MPRSQLSPFQLVFDHNPAALAVTRRRDSVIIEVNDAFCALVSYKREEIIGATALNLGIWPQPSDRSRLVAEIESSGRVQNMQVPLRARDHSLRYVEVSSELTDFGGEPCLLTMIIDRTERHHVEQERDQALAEAEQFRAALDNVPAFVYMKDLEHRYTYANAMTLELVGKTKDTIAGSEDREFFPPEAVERLHEVDRRVFRGERTSEEIEVADTGSGRRIYWEVKAPLYEAGKVKGLVGISTDITQHKNLERRLAHMAYTDYLTGLPNRSYFFEMAQKEFARARRYGEPLAIAMIDLDHFKLVNDTYGHEVGDMVLKEVARVCRVTLRESDLIGRIGGEEFAVLWPNADRAHASDAAERLRAAIDIAKLPLEHGLPVQFTASLGVATITEADANIDVILHRADKALYEAKAAGRNCVKLA